MAVLDGEPRSATIIARERCRLLKLDGDNLTTLMEEMPDISFALVRMLSKRVRTLEQRIGQHATAELEDETTG